jgi:hypothetical protein
MARRTSSVGATTFLRAADPESPVGRSSSSPLKPTYAAVHVLLLSWEDDDLGVVKEIDELYDIFRALYGFQVEEFKIPPRESDDAVHQVLNTFVKGHQSSRTLLLVYYGGHGFLNQSRLLVWAR